MYKQPHIFFFLFPFSFLFLGKPFGTLYHTITVIVMLHHGQMMTPAMVKIWARQTGRRRSLFRSTSCYTLLESIMLSR